MRYVKIPAVALAALAAMMMVVGSASATSLTSPAGTVLGVNIKAESEGQIQFDLIDSGFTFPIACAKSTFEGKVMSAEGTTASASISSLSLECGTNTFSVLKPGSLELHATGGSNGTMTWNSAEITVLTHNILGTIHCIFKANNTDLGTFTGSSTTGGTATLDVSSSQLSAVATDFVWCEGASLTGSYKFANPDSLTAEKIGESTALTSPSWMLKAVSEAPHIKMDGSVTLTCEESAIEAEITEPHVVKATVTSLSLTKCGNNTLTVLNGGHGGTLTIDSKGEITSTGIEITALTHNILGTVHCIYKTNSTSVGTLTGNSTTGGTATWDIGSAGIPEVATDTFACKEDAVLTGNYSVTSPDFLDVDASSEPPPGIRLTSPKGTAFGVVGAKIKAASESPQILMDGTIHLTCQQSVVESEITEPHVAEAKITSLTFTECGNNTVTVLNGGFGGSLSISAKGEIRSTGAEFTVLTHNMLGTVHCIYRTSNTPVGTLTDSTTTGATATWDIGSSPIPQTATDTACKNDAVLTGNYSITSPDSLYLD